MYFTRVKVDFQCNFPPKAVVCVVSTTLAIENSVPLHSETEDSGHKCVICCSSTSLQNESPWKACSCIILLELSGVQSSGLCLLFFPAGGVDESILAAPGAASGRTWRQFRELAGPDPRFGSALEFAVRPGRLYECVIASLGWLNKTYVWTF